MPVILFTIAAVIVGMVLGALKAAVEMEDE